MTKAERNAAILAMLSEGHMQKTVCAHFGISRQRLNSIVCAQPGYIPRKDRPAGQRTQAYNVPAVPQPRSDAELKADWIASRGVTRCPTVALMPTQATVAANLGIRDPWAGKTTWPASEAAHKKAREKTSRRIASSSLASNKIGATV